MDYLYTVDISESLNAGDYKLLGFQGGISSKQKLSFKEDFNISFKSVLGGYSKFPLYRGSGFYAGFHKDNPNYVNKVVDKDKKKNFSVGISGAKDSFALVIDYGRGGEYCPGEIYLADTTTKTNDKKDFKKLSPTFNMWYNKEEYNYKEYTIKRNMAVANVSVTWNSKR